MLNPLSFVQPGRTHWSGARSDRSIFEEVREKVDLHKVLPPPSDSREFDSYYLTHCIHPDHPDKQMSMMVFHDGANCRACGFKGDTTAVYQLLNPDLSPYEAAQQLLSGDYVREVDTQRKRELRNLDQDLPLRSHLALAADSEALRLLEAFGFERTSIQRYRIGWHRVLVPLLPSDESLLEGAPNIEIREREGKLRPYQWQWRFSVPVYDSGSLRQMIYRKAHRDDLGAKVQLEWGAGTQWLFNGEVLSSSNTVVLCEGWGDAIILNQLGYAAVTGISGAGQFHPSWKDRLGRVRRLYVLGDPDTAGLRMMNHVREQLPWARPVVLPEPGKDVRQLYLEGYRRLQFDKLFKRADLAPLWRPS